MIFLHHSLVSYQDWPEFIKIVGGQYHIHPVVVNGDTLKANYEHDVNISVKVEDKKHPLTRGISDFEIFDEVYGDVEILQGVKPLLSTTHPKSMHYLAWPRIPFLVRSTFQVAALFNPSFVESIFSYIH